MTIYNDYRLQQQIDGIMASGVGGADLPDGSTGALLVGSGIEWEATTSGRFLAASGVITDGLTIGNIYIEPNEIIFPDGSEATTARTLLTCTGTVITQIFTLNYDDTYPKDLFVLPPNCEIISATVTVISGFIGGYGYESAPTLETLGVGNANTGAGNTNMQETAEALVPGWWVTQFGIYSTASQVIKPKYAKRAYVSAGVSSAAYESITPITVSGGTTSFTKTGGSYWQPIDLFVVPSSGTYLIGYYSVVAAANGKSSTTYTNYGLHNSAKTGDLTGVQVGFTCENYGLQVAIRYAISYYIGDENDNDSIVPEFTPSIYSTVSGLAPGAGWAPEIASRQIKIYRRQSVEDSSGQMQVTIQYRERCFDNLLIPSISGGENVYVERTDYNNWVISSMTPCYQSLCQRTIDTNVSGIGWPHTLTLLPANHILQSVVLTTSGISGGYGATDGWSLPRTGTISNMNDATQVFQYFTLVNGAAITRAWVWSTTACTVTLKIAKEVSTTIYELTNIGDFTHLGQGEQQFDFAPVTVTGTGSDMFHLAAYFPTGVNANAFATTPQCYQKTGNLTGTQSAFSAYAYSYSVRIGYVPSLSIGTDIEPIKFISSFTVISGSVSAESTFGPYSDVKPITLNLLPTSSAPPTNGILRMTYTYYNPSSIQYNRGYGLTWSGTGGTEIPHNFGSTAHLLYVAPQDVNPGAWWVSKGENTDMVYSDTLSGTGSFDWFIQM